ncbi:MAG: hypothetical protein U0R80_20050 [Nocardioidaceae bacterium]
MFHHQTRRSLTRAAGRALGATAVAAAVAWPGAALACGHGHGHSAERQAVRTVRQATAALHTTDRAEHAGYAQFLTCTQQPGEGAMGTHWVNGDLVGDSTIDKRHPEALVFETLPDGTLRLVAGEYIVFQEGWDAANTEPPSLFGRDFELVEAPNRYGIPAFYEMHVWAWKANPSGVFEDWNPRVTCDYAEGDPI